MSLTHKVGVVYSSDAGQITNTTDSFTGDSEVNYDGTVPAGTSYANGEIDIAVTRLKVKCMVMISDQAVTVKTNSVSTPGDTIALAAGIQLVWNTNHLEAIPITVNVTKMFINNAGSNDAKIKMRFLVDVTPNI